MYTGSCNDVRNSLKTVDPLLNASEAALLCYICIQGRRKRGGRGGLSRPTFLGNLNYELVHSVESAIEDKRVDRSARPDIVIVSENEKKMALIEPTISHNSLESISNARGRKSSKENYQQA